MMKRIQWILYALLILAFLGLESCSGSSEDPVTPEPRVTPTPINDIPEKTYIPDDGFEQNLIDLGVDDVLDDSVATASIDTIKSLTLLGKGFPEEAFDAVDVTDLTGLQNFTNLEELNLAGCATGSMDLTLIPNLKILYFYYSQSPGIRNMPQLEELYFQGSSAGVAEISTNPSLNYISVNEAGMPYIINDNPLLEEFYGVETGTNQIISFTENPNLLVLNMLYVSYDALELEDSPSLQNLISVGSSLSNLDLTAFSALTYAELPDNELEAIDVSNCTQLNTFLIYNNPLTCIQVNEDQLNAIPTAWEADPDDTYSLDCSSAKYTSAEVSKSSLHSKTDQITRWSSIKGFPVINGLLYPVKQEERLNFIRALRSSPR